MRKKYDIIGKRSVILTRIIINEIKDNPLINNLYITDIGFYPKVFGHYTKRDNGLEQNILIYCVDGVGYVQVNGVDYRVDKDHYFIIPANTPHMYYADKVDPWTLYWAHFDGEKSSNFIDEQFSVKFLKNDKFERYEKRTDLFEEIFRNYEINYSLNNLILANLCFEYFLASFKYNNEFELKENEEVNDLIELSMNYMKNNISKRLSLEDISKQFNLSPTHFSFLFRKQTSRSPIDFFITLKIQHACNLLKNTNYQIKEVAYLVGYDNPYYFSRIFKELIGFSPVDFRKKEKTFI